MRTQSICVALAIVLVCPFASAQWVQTSLDSIVVSCFATSGTNLFVGAGRYIGYPNRGVFLSTDSGASWSRAGLTDSLVGSVAANGTNLFAGIYGLSGGRVFLSTNNGTSWTGDSAGLPGGAIAAIVVSDTNLFAGIDHPFGAPTPLDSTKYGVWLSTDNGRFWRAANAGLASKNVLALTVSGINLFAGTHKGVFLSTDNGTNWTPVNSGLPTDLDVNALAVSDTNLFAGVWDYFQTDCVFRSTNNGTSWTAVSNGLPNTFVNAFAVSGGNLFAGTSSGIFLSTNNGTNWSPVNTGLTDTNVYALVASGTNLYAGTASGVWKRPLSEMITDVQSSSGEPPIRYSLSENYPNPFNPTTTIKYELPRASHVMLTVYDVLGREVTTLVNGVEMPGHKSVQFSASNLASGVYFYRLQAGDFVQSKKLLVLK